MPAADDALLAAFLDCTLPPEQLGHPEHVRLSLTASDERIAAAAARLRA